MDKRMYREKIRLAIELITAESLEEVHDKYDDEVCYGVALQKEASVLVVLNKLVDELTIDIGDDF